MSHPQSMVGMTAEDHMSISTVSRDKSNDAIMSFFHFPLRCQSLIMTQMVWQEFFSAVIYVTCSDVKISTK